MSLTADSWARIKAEVAKWPPLVEDQQATVASLAPSKDRSEAA